MKQHITLSIDRETLAIAREKTDNMSGLVENFLKNFAGIDKTSEDEVSRAEIIRLEDEIEKENAVLANKRTTLVDLKKKFKKKHPISIKLGD